MTQRPCQEAIRHGPRRQEKGEELEDVDCVRAPRLPAPCPLCDAHSLQQRAVLDPQQRTTESGARLEGAEAVHRCVGGPVARVHWARESTRTVTPEEQAMPLR